ncbi:MAG: hypothetical protein KC912_25010 [Proteobacteria bacterium]|nr:hypothetical protein [Pseudomonadota bacterium]
MNAARVSDVVAAAERVLRQRFANAGASLGLDAAERWGPQDPDSLRRLAEETHRLNEERRTLEAAIRERAARVRESGEVAVWSAAHVRLLDAFIAASAGDENASTHVSVASEERAAWETFSAEDERPPKQNCFYVTYDPELYEALFGFRPEDA